ncbi:MAG: U32 family peptidase [Gammaproteobacteria bacterium]|nr:U32 family peptidase [Gammaproteobacteria bacterium]
MRLALGPLLYYWDRESIFDFYKSIQDTAVDIVYLGEVVCGKRRTMRLPDWLQIGEELAAAGKEVVLSTLALIEAESELATLRKICANGRFPVEANDMAAVYALAKLKQPFIGGPHLNIYNPEALAMLACSGARRWTIPVEMSASTLAAIQAQRPAQIETEVFALGRLPLAFSARCFTARAHGHGKDDCGFVCAQYPEGLPLYTQEKEPFLILNGIQTQSASLYSLVEHLEELEQLEVDVVRVSPFPGQMAEIIELLHAAVMDTAKAEKTAAAIQEHLTLPVNDGYWRGRPGIGGT